MSRMISPNELLAEAKKQMLDGREPKTHTDWTVVMNFMAVNIDAKAQPEACLLMRTIYDMPLSDEEVKAIVDFHINRRGSCSSDRKNGTKP